MSLETYRGKRDFTATPEPKGGKRGSKARGTLSFVVQKHAARRLHYDFRLEANAVLMSWAVTRGPSLVPGEKRLAVHVEDHPLDYGDFEGTIPKGEYGGGAVIVWDRGDWKPVGDMEKGLAKGHLEFELDGEKLRGRWHLVRMAAKPREKRENWLLIKAEDAFARAEGDADILEEAPLSVKTGRAITEVADKPATTAARKAKGGKPPSAARTPKGASKADYPGFIPPALARLRPAAPVGEQWLREIKFDGYRLQAHLNAGKVMLLTRTGRDWTEKFGTAVSKALGALSADAAIIDGEMVVETGGGASDFAALQADLSEGRSDRFVYYAFDLLYLDGEDWRGAPLEARKARLAELMEAAKAPLRLSEHFEEEGEMVLRHVCRLSLEGIISKKRDGRYVSGRGPGWIKSKCTQRQEFVVAGFAPSSTQPEAIGSLLLGYYDGEKFLRAGRVGTGFSQRVAKELFTRLEPLGRDAPPFADTKAASAADRREIRFVAPELVVEVEFHNWTTDGTLRHASFRGLRDDKPAAEIGREDRARGKPDKPAKAIRLTHPDRVYWDDAGVTKEGLADYYARVWPRMAPFVVGRPLALLRCPRGTGASCFFQKHAWKGQSREILVACDPLDEGESAAESILAVDGLDGVVGLAQGAVLEIHTWQSTLTDLERPDQIVMDLDPGAGVAWPAMIEAAEEVRRRLEAAGLSAFVKTSGGKGLHVTAPLVPGAGWDRVKTFAKSIADAMASDSPDLYVATVSKARRRGKILIDYLRNGRGATAVAPYSTRARAGAPVSMPLDWTELGAVSGAYFTVGNTPNRLAGLETDPWSDFRAAAVPLDAASRPRRAR